MATDSTSTSRSPHTKFRTAPRRRLLDLVREHERSVGELVDALGVSQPGVSRHLRVLREADLVTVRRDAQQRWYRLRADPLLELEHWLAPYRRLWRGKLDDLEDYLERNQTDER